MRRLFFVLLLSLASVARAFDVPPATGHVNDLAGVLAESPRTSLEQALADVARTGRIEVAVLTVKSLNGETVESVAQHVFDTWKPGQKGQDKGLLMLVAVDDRKVRLQPGYGLEGELPDGKIGRILDERVLPHFKDGDWAGGIEGGLAAALHEAGVELAVGEPQRPPPRRGQQLSLVQLLMLLGALGLVGVGCIVSPTMRFIVLEILLTGGRGGQSRGGDGGFGGGSSGGGGASRGW